MDGYDLLVLVQQLSSVIAWWLELSSGRLVSPTILTLFWESLAGHVLWLRDPLAHPEDDFSGKKEKTTALNL